MSDEIGREIGLAANPALNSPGTAIRASVREFCRVHARELLDNDGDPRRPPQAHRDALRGMLEQVGIAGALVAYESGPNGGPLTGIDGHVPEQYCDLD